MNGTREDVKSNGADVGTRAVGAIRISAADSAARPERCQVVVEAPVTIDVRGVGAYTILCTPCDLRALAVGFVFSEGVIASLDDIVLLVECEDAPGAIRVQVRDPEGAASERNLAVASSCGMCGGRNIDGICRGLTPCGDALRVLAPRLAALPETLRARQQIFATTGAAHAAGIFTAEGEIVAFAEDIGRHNALDKAIGKCLLSARGMAGCGAVLSGRVSFELVVKAARAGIELIAAVSAPTSLAVDAAERCNVTLCGFVRGDRATVYTHPGRIEGLHTC